MYCQSVYEPGKRHWLKIKKDYLADGTMADSADLVVLGAYFGTGSKGKCVVLFELVEHGGLVQVIATLVRSTKLLYAGPG